MSKGGNRGSESTVGSEADRASSSSGASEQEMLTELRERYLRMVTALARKPVVVEMHGKTRVDGTFVAMKADGTHFAVDSLHTPLGVVDHAVLRTGDTLCIRAPLNHLAPSPFLDTDG